MFIVTLVLAYARRQGWVVLSMEQLDRALLYLAFEDERLKKLGGGNASKLRDPRKTLRRLVQRLGRNLSYLTQSTPLDPVAAAPAGLRRAARKQLEATNA
jgi:hypothetical protein